MSDREGEGKRKERQNNDGWQRKMASVEEKGETSVLKPACTLPEGILREGFVGKTPNRADMHGGLSWGSSRPDAGSISVFVWAGGAKAYIQELLERRRGSFYHACLVFRSSSHGLTERQVLKAVDWGRSVGVMFQLSFVEEDLQVLLTWQLCSHALLLQSSFWVSLERLKLTPVVFCYDGFDCASQNDWLLWFYFLRIKEVVWTYARGQGAGEREWVDLITAGWGMQGSDSEDPQPSDSCCGRAGVIPSSAAQTVYTSTLAVHWVARWELITVEIS